MRKYIKSSGIGLACVTALVMGCSSDSGGPSSGAAASMGVASGSVQSGTVGAPLTTPIGVRVVDASGDPVSGVAVTFAVTVGGGSVAAAGPVNTNSGGVASTIWTIGTVAGLSNNTATARVTGLSGSPVTFTATGLPGAATTVEAVSGDNQNAVLFQGTAEPLIAVVEDSYGNTVPGTSVIWTISGGGSGSTGTTVTDAAGRTSATRTVGGTISGYTTTASLTTGGAGFYNFVTLGTAVASGYNVRVQFLTPMTANQRNAFLDAAARWSSIIVGNLPSDQVVGDPGECGSNSPAIDETIDDVLIYATIAPIDGVGGILGGAGPCWVRLPGYLTLVGDMTFDVADMAALESNNLLQPVILHEMGHVLGFGTLWTYVTPPLLTFGGTDSTYFNGATAISWYNIAGGSAAFPSLYAVPVENTGGPGTQDGHWRETVMTNELMTGWINLGSNPLSAITIGSLSDLAYTVNYTTADTYAITAPPVGAPSVAGTAIQMRELPRTGPIRGVDRQGRITRVR